MSRLTLALFDPAALRHNLQVVRRKAPASRILAVVKANAYGHGVVASARALHGADAFAVACIEEALCLRNAGIRQPIVLLEGFFAAKELPLLAKHRLQTIIHDFAQIKQLQRSRLSVPLEVWLKIDTGMHRLGFAPHEAKEAWNKLTACAQVIKPVRLMTHLACADERDNPMTPAQIQRFTVAVEGLPGARSIANSAGILAWPQSHTEWVRPGLMLYGASPFAGTTAQTHNLRPVMEFRSVLIRVNQCRAGDSIGYGATWRCPEDMSIGVVAAGYGDGYPRHASAGTPVWVDGRLVPLVGRVSMDMSTVDLRGVPQPRIGAPVVLWGRELPVEIVAMHADTIPYTLLTGITARVKRAGLDESFHGEWNLG